MILKPLSKLLFKIRLAQLNDINTRAPFLLATVEPFRMEPDLATHQGVVCVTVRAVVRACVITRQFIFEKQQGLYHNKVTLGLTPV